jgi:hypothetical protein
MHVDDINSKLHWHYHRIKKIQNQYCIGWLFNDAIRSRHQCEDGVAMDYKPKMDPALTPSLPPNNAKMWGAVSGALSSCAVAVMASPIPWPWGLVVGGVLAAASAVTAMMAAKRFDAQELAKFLSLLAEAKANKDKK